MDVRYSTPWGRGGGRQPPSAEPEGPNSIGTSLVSRSSPQHAGVITGGHIIGSCARIDNHLDSACTMMSTVRIVTCFCGDWHASHAALSWDVRLCGSGRSPADVKDASRSAL
eukprot:845907-Amphidinium_carterae.1